MEIIDVYRKIGNTMESLPRDFLKDAEPENKPRPKVTPKIP